MNAAISIRKNAESRFRRKITANIKTRTEGIDMTAKNAFYAQSGGVTAVINASACGVIETARAHPDKIANVYAGRNGIIGALTEELIDTSRNRPRRSPPSNTPHPAVSAHAASSSRAWSRTSVNTNA